MTEHNLEQELNDSEKWLVDGLAFLRSIERFKYKYRTIDKDIIVNAGETLTIYPGSVWDFSEGKGIYIQGGLIRILGTEKEPILLQAKMTSWGGISLVNTKLDNILNYTTIKDGMKDYGGGISTYNSILTLQNCNIYECEAKYDGGGICNNNNSSISMENTVIISNRAKFGGGINNTNNSSIDLISTAVIANNAEYYGGGIFNFINSSSRIKNTTITENYAEQGGGIYNHNGKVTSHLKSKIIQIGKNTIENNTLENIYQHTWPIKT